MPLDIVQISTQSWGIIVDSDFNPYVGALVTLKNLNGTNATHYSDILESNPLTNVLVAGIGGILPRFIASGKYTISVNGGPTSRIEATSGTGGTGGSSVVGYVLDNAVPPHYWQISSDSTGHLISTDLGTTPP